MAQEADGLDICQLCTPPQIPVGWHHSRFKEWPVPRNLDHLVKSSGETAFVGRILFSSPDSQLGLILRCTSQKQPCICLRCSWDQYTDRCYGFRGGGGLCGSCPFMVFTYNGLGLDLYTLLDAITKCGWGRALLFGKLLQ